jgi:hypothetical protein
MLIASPTESLHPTKETDSQTGVPSMGDQGSWQRPAASLWSNHTEGGMCGSPDSSGQQEPSKQWSPSSADRR